VPDIQPSTLRQAAEAEVLTQIPRLRRLPQRIDDLLGQATQGKPGIRMSSFSNQRDVDTITTLVNRVVPAIISSALGPRPSALGLGSVLLLRVGAAGASATDPNVDEVLGYLGLAIAAVLMLRIVAGVVRDGRS